MHKPNFLFRCLYSPLHKDQVIAAHIIRDGVGEALLDLIDYHAYQTNPKAEVDGQNLIVISHPISETLTRHRPRTELIFNGSPSAPAHGARQAPQFAEWLRYVQLSDDDATILRIPRRVIRPASIRRHALLAWSYFFPGLDKAMYHDFVSRVDVSQCRY